MTELPDEFYDCDDSLLVSSTPLPRLIPFHEKESTGIPLRSPIGSVSHSIPLSGSVSNSVFGSNSIPGSHSIPVSNSIPVFGSVPVPGSNPLPPSVRSSAPGSTRGQTQIQTQQAPNSTGRGTGTGKSASSQRVFVQRDEFASMLINEHFSSERTVEPEVTNGKRMQRMVGDGNGRRNSQEDVVVKDIDRNVVLKVDQVPLPNVYGSGFALESEDVSPPQNPVPTTVQETKQASGWLFGGVCAFLLCIFI